MNDRVQATEEQIRRLPCWRGDIGIESLDGGITNHNFKVRDAGDNSVYVVRLGADIPVHHISRVREVAAGQAAHAAGISPQIVHAADGVLVMRFIDGKTLTPGDVANRAMLERILPLVKACHTNVSDHLRGSAPFFWVFHVLRDYAASLRDANSSHLARLPELLHASDSLHSASAPFDIVFGHNDLLAANLIDTGDQLWLIDWEYAGYNSPLFDLGGLASNNGLSEADERWLLDAYYETAATDDLWRRYQAMKCASLLRETFWSMISELHSTIDFDYAAYTAENLERFEKSYATFQTLA